MKSISYLISYSKIKDKYSKIDRLGGFPSHLPYACPRCNICQEKMAFIGQIYQSDIIKLQNNNIALQFYLCEERCNLDVDLLIHVEAIPESAAVNTDKRGVESKTQSLLSLNYEALEDPVDQWTFIKNNMTDEISESYYTNDKIHGLFPYDGSELPEITKDNIMVAQFLDWECTETTSIYLYYTTGNDYYLAFYS